MAFDTAYLNHPHTGQTKVAPVGFSWTMFFFGFFPPLFRGDWKWFAITFVGGIILALMSGGLLGWVVGFVSAFIWNKSYLTGLIEKGYQLRGSQSGQLDRIDSYLGFVAPRSSNATERSSGVTVRSSEIA